ncbi:MAG: hypothetical protein K940chlam9_00797 [Chlamydiae bacterium]|nr:hypothetical protein [Chlamydiota bacterium]
MIGPEKLTILLAKICCVDCIIEVGVFPLGKVEDPPDEGEERELFFLVEDTLVWFGPILKVAGVGVFALGDAGVGVALVEVTTSPIAIPLASYLCP